MTVLNERRSLVLGVAHLFLSISSGWALKNVQGSKYSIGAFSFALIYGIAGIIFCTHPNPTSTSRRFSSTSFSYFVSILLPMLIVEDVLLLTKANNIWRHMTTIAAILQFGASLTHLLTRWKFLNHGFFLWSVGILSYVSYNIDDLYWTVGLLLLILLNNLVLIKLPGHYEISLLEISTVGFCFFIIFALNSVNEIAFVMERRHGTF